MTQAQALNILKTGANVFLTGPAGSGKTYVLNQYIKYLKEHNVPIGITASTGIAATHMGGMTIHSWSGIGIKDRLSLSDIAEIGEKTHIKRKISEAKVLIIDEVSMLHHFRFDMIERVLRHIKKSQEPFGGIQVVLCGDFFQLPPVARLGEPDPHFIYESQAWKEGNFTICYLHENYRQSDDLILSILNEIRSGEVSDEARGALQGRYVKGEIRDESLENRNYSSHEALQERGGSDEIEPTRLYTHNIDVDGINERELAKVEDLEITYEMSTRGRKPLVEVLKKSCLAPEKLKLKKGARVMCVKNNFDKGYVNGTLGVVVSCGHFSDPVIRTAAVPDYPQGRLVTIEKAFWQIDEDGKIIAELEQYPLRLAWAITVHKSQGMSLDAAEVDLSKAFSPGMGYVALSRVRTLGGLRITGFSERAFAVHSEVLEFDRHLRELSEKAERIFDYTDEKDIVGKQTEFMARVAPLHALGSNSKGSKPAKISTYDKTALLVKEGKSLGEIAKIRGLEEETIIGQLEKIFEGGKGIKESLKPADVLYFKKEISHPHFLKIEEALEKVAEKQGDDKPPLLSAVKNIVGPNVSWKEIRLARVVLGYWGNK